MIRRNNIWFIGVGFVLLISQTVWGFEATRIPNQFPLVGRSIRPLGMGNTLLTAKGFDDSSFYYNPAAINDYRKFHFTLMSPETSLTTKSIALVKDIKDLKNNLDKESTDGGKTRTFDTFFQDHVGEFHSLNLFLPALSIRSRYLFMSAIVDSRTDISFRNRAFPNFEVSSQDVAGVMVGTSYAFMDDTLQVGVGMKFLYKTYLSEILRVEDALSSTVGTKFKFNNWAKGFGVGADIGTKYQIPHFASWVETLKPSVALVWQDVGKTRFAGAVPNTQQSISAGIGIHPEFAWADFSLMADFRELNQNRDFMTMLHAGAEARLAKKSKLIRPSLRVGTNQGYPAFGAGVLLLSFLKVDAAYFAEEVGQLNRQAGNYRVAGSLGFDF